MECPGIGKAATAQIQLAVCRKCSEEFRDEQVSGSMLAQFKSAKIQPRRTILYSACGCGNFGDLR
jgi:predicted Zn-ribbon and HTH transcriptional regulator